MAEQRLALVTGAASGLGAVLACQLIGANYRVIAIDRDAARISAAIAHPNLVALGVDLADGERIEALADALAEPLDLVIHCAGTSCVGPFLHQAAAVLMPVYRVNLTAPILLTNALMARGRLAPGSALVFVSSLSHYSGYPGAAMYAATKDGVTAYARALSVALAVRGVHVMIAFPGPIDTPHARTFAPPGSRRSARLSPERVAAAIIAGVAQRRSRLVIGVGPNIARLIGLLWPNLMTRLMGRFLWPKLALLNGTRRP